MVSDLNKLGIALKSLDAMNLGTVGVNLANVEAYRTALKGLSVEQSVFALASKGATEEQIRQILVTNQATAEDVEAAMAKAGLTTATQALTQAEMVEMATKTGVAKATAEELLSKIGITATETGQIPVKKQVTRAMLEQAVASGTLTKAEASQIATMLGLNAVETTNIGITNVLTASFTKLWAVITAHPIGAILTAIGAVAVGAIAYINKTNKEAEEALVEAHENAKQALDDTKNSLSDDKSELQSVNSELETTKERLKEISSIGAPTLTEQNELTKLSTANAQLEAQQTLLENNIKLKQKAAALDAKELLGTQVEMEYSSILDGSSITSATESYSYDDHAKYQASNLKNAYNIYMKALRDGDVKKQQLAQELIDASAGDSAVLTSELLEIVESFKYDDGTIIEGYEDLYNEYMGMIYNLQSLTNPDTFLEIAKSVTTGKGIDYEKAISEAYNLAYEGNFDVASLNQDFVKALADAGIDESTISYIFKLKQQEYQLLVDKINSKYDSSKVQYTYWDGEGKIHHDYEKENSAKADVEKVNQELNEYARENPIEFQLVSSYDENFILLDKYIEEEKKKATNSADYVGDYVENAIQRIYDEAKVKSDTFNNEITDLTTISQSVSQIAQQIKPQFDELGEAYKDIFTTDGFTLENVGNEMLESLRASFQDINDDLQEIGLTPIDSSELDKFLGVLSDVNSTEQEVQQAFNDIATTWLYSTDVINGLNDATAESIEKQLEEMGVINAHEVVTSNLVAKTEALVLQKQIASAEAIALANNTEFSIAAFLDEAKASEVTRLYLFNLIAAEQVFNNQDLDVSGKIQKLQELATAYGETALAANLARLQEQAQKNGIELTEADIATYQKNLQNQLLNIQNAEIDFKRTDTSSASKAGKDSGDAYVEAYEEELKELENLRDRGEISESEYLSRMKALYEKYFAGISKYQDKYFEEQSKYLEGMKSLYDSALSGISKLMSDQIDSVQEERDVTITALEEERDARLEVIDAQKEQLQAEIDLIDEQIEAKQEIIDGIQDEIDKIREANEERKRQIELQKAQYELERMQNQRTDLIYKNGQMVYVADTEGIRDARENVEDAKLEIEIAEKEKEISLIEDEIELLEKQKDAIQDQIDALDKQADSIEKYYSKMITQQERYYDSLIKNMEKQKSKWEELAEIQEVAEAYSAIEQVFGDLGYTVEDVLNGSTGVFEDFKTKYIGLINDMNSNSSFAEGLSYATGLAEENLGSFLGKTQEVSQGLDDLSSKGEGLSTVADAMDKIGTSATTLATDTEGLDENLSGITDSLTTIPDGTEVLSGWATGFTDLGNAIKGVAEALGLTEENSIGGLVDALQSVSEISLGSTEDGESTGIIGQFNALKEAVDSVTSSISGCASGGSEGDASGSKSSSMSAGATEGGEGGLVSAIEKMGESAIETLGEGSSEDGSEGEGEGVIGKFAQLKTAVDSVTTAIGTGEEEEGSGEEGATTLIGALQKQYEKAEEVLPEEKLLFEELLISIEACVAALNNMTSSMSAMFEIGFPSGGISFTPLAKGTVGKAFAKGTGKYDGLPHNEKNALRSEYGQPELTVYPDGTTELTTEPTMSDLPKNTVIFNEEQTKRIMDGRGDILGNVFRDGTINNDSILLSHVGSLQKDDSGYALMKSFEIYQDMLSSQIVPTLNTIENNTDTVARNISNINNNNTQPAYVLNGGINVTCPNVTDAEIAKRVGGEIEKAFFGMSNYANQRSSITR